MKRTLVAALVAGTLAACASEQKQVFKVDGYRECMARVASDQIYTPLKSKTSTAGTAEIGTAMLADESYPSAEDKVLIAKWSDARDRCFAVHTTTLKESLPPEAFGVFKASIDKQKILASDLYSSRLTYGQFNRTRIADGQAVETAFEKIRELYAARQDQENQQRRQVLLMQLQNQLSKPTGNAPMPAPYMMPSPAPASSTTNCTTIGNQVNCVSR